MYNFQFIIDAFAPVDTASTQPADSAGIDITIKGVELDKIRLVFDDAITGSDMTLWLEHFDTDIDVFDLDKMRFSVPTTNISGIHANIYQRKPLVEPIEVIADTAEQAPPPEFDFDFDEFNLENINVDYGNDVSAFYTKLNLGKFVLNADNVDMKKQSITLNEIQLDNTTAAIRLGKTEQAKIVAKEVEQEATKQTKSGWVLIIKKINFNNNNLAFENDNEPRSGRGMDYAHLNAKGFTFHADNLIFSPDSIGARITRGELSEQSGFRLNTFETEFLHTGQQTYLHNLLIETPGTILRKSIDLRYHSLDALKKDIGQLQLDVNLNQCRIQVKDILTFVPALSSQPAFSNPSAFLHFTGNITGAVNNMNIRRFFLRGFNDTRVDVRGKIAGLPDAKKIKGNLVLSTFETSRKDIQMLAPKGSLPKNITIPQLMSLQGTIAGSMQNARADLDLKTSLGDASLKGSISNPTDKHRAKYDATVVTNDLNLGVIMQNDSMFGPLTANISASGTGFDPKTASANVNALINSAVLNRYNYTDVKIHADLANQKANFNLDINDPNITIALNGNSDLSGKFPAVMLNAVVDTLRTLPLNFTKDALDYHGNISADFPNTDPANLEGELLVTKSVLTTKDQKYPFDTIALTSGVTDTGKYLNLRSDALSFALSGKYNLAEMGSVFQQAIQPYYSLGPTANKDTIQEYDFRFDAVMVDGPILKIFAPTLSQLEPVRMQGHFASNSGWQTNIDAPLIVMGANRIQKLKLQAGTSQNAIKFKTEMERFSSGSTMNIYGTAINATIAENKINFLFNTKDIGNKNKYRFGGTFDQPQEGIYSLILNPDSLLLNYDKWQIDDKNIVRLNKGDVNISNFTITRGKQQLSINSTSQAPNSPMDIKLTDFRIATLTAFAKQDTALVDGIMNGHAVIKDIATQPMFTSDLMISDLMFRHDTVGNLSLKVNNTVANVYAADINLTGKGNEIVINGNYHVKPANQSMYDLKMDIRALQMSSVEAFSMGSISRGSGIIDGKFDISGTVEKPNVNGQLNFNQTAFTPTMLGSYFLIDKESIVINGEGVKFDSFTILDSSKNKLVLDGNAYTTNFLNYKLDLDLDAKDFQALNSTKLNNKLFYGRFFFDTDLHISGTELSPRVSGNLKVNDKTNITVVMPQAGLA